MITPKASVVLPAFNGARFIGQAIESILKQTFTDFELIVIDDCSRDNTWELIKEYAAKDNRVIALKNDSNMNLPCTVNRGIALAKGDYIVRMDHDDISLPSRLEKQINFMEKHPKVGIVGCSVEIIDEQGAGTCLREYNLTDETIRRNIFLYSPFCHPAIVVRRSVLEAAGNYNPAYIPAEDYELYFRIGKYAEFANLSEVLFRYRVVEGTSMTTSGTRKMEKKTIIVRRKYSNSAPYRMRAIDHLYNYFHYLSLFCIPSRFKIWVFSKLRNS